MVKSRIGKVKKASPALRAGGSENNKQQDNIFESVDSC
jgi:hypothetical protein